MYENVSIPLTTGSFLFYAKSAAAGTGSDAEKKFQVGSLTPANLTSTNPSSFSFSLEQMVTDASELTVASANGGKLLAYLSSVACANDGDATNPRAWYQYNTAAGDNAAIVAMFATFTSLHGLSSFEVERVLTDLNKSLKPLSSPIATAIKTAINNSTYATINASDEVELIAALDNFPQEHNLPVGSIDIVWDGTNHVFKQGSYSGMATPDKYVYPAQLWYYVNSVIATSNTSKKTLYENTSSTWSAIVNEHQDAASVNTKTRAVAIVNPIQYAVARFDVQVKLAAAGMADNSDLAEGAATEVDCSAGFPVTAVLVGGQRNVGFDFTPLASATVDYTIYDNAMNSSTMKATSSDYSALNHTLVLENGTSDVMVAVELQNDAVDFYGRGNQLIPHGGKFYVVGKLSAAAATETSGHVFKQDYKTIARLTLTDLRKAYNTIPDLRTPELELGFSVDLTWESGHTYTINLDE
ncbi:MAG: hypothetical protein J5621_03845 [Paludibacteraceae bacterium]|nr:hypothetical protein [Paludibacteraceae bacterium]